MLKKCTLCGGRLVNGKCEFCGLDNTMYNRDYLREPRTAKQREADKEADGTHVRKSAGASVVQPGKRSERRAGWRAGRSSGRAEAAFFGGQGRTSVKRTQAKVGLVILVLVLIFMLLPPIVESGSNIAENLMNTEPAWQQDEPESYNSYEDYDPYAYVTRDIPAEGDTYESVLGNGYYLVGVHIPEGVYTVELENGDGTLEIADDENIIFEYTWFGEEEEYSAVKYKEDVRLYSGAWISVKDAVLLKFETANAQPLLQQPGENPLTGSETVLEEGTHTVGEDIPEGIYDVYLRADEESGVCSATLSYPNEEYEEYEEYLILDSDPSGMQGYYFDNGIKNVILPAGTKITVEGAGMEMQPSEGYFDIDFQSYSPYENYLS